MKLFSLSIFELAQRETLMGMVWVRFRLRGIPMPLAVAIYLVFFSSSWGSQWVAAGLRLPQPLLGV
jgi:hypothetical protein